MRKERQKEKQERREVRKKERDTTVVRGEGEEDPDIAGIVPGPQPLPEEFS
jgi:hypothetical protein